MSVYAITIPCFAQMLQSLMTLLSKGEAPGRALGFDPQNLLDARLAPDMHTLARQVELSCTQAQEAVSRLTRQARLRPATPADMAAARAPVNDTLLILAAADRSLIDASAQQPVPVTLTDGLTFDMTGHEYAVNRATPQFSFTW